MGEWVIGFSEKEFQMAEVRSGFVPTESTTWLLGSTGSSMQQFRFLGVLVSGRVDRANGHIDG